MALQDDKQKHVSDWQAGGICLTVDPVDMRRGIACGHTRQTTHLAQ